jgi:hypothetical protein
VLVEKDQKPQFRQMTVDAVAAVEFRRHSPVLSKLPVAGFDALVTRFDEKRVFGGPAIGHRWYLEKSIAQSSFALVHFECQAADVAQTVCRVIAGSVGHVMSDGCALRLARSFALIFIAMLNIPIDSDSKFREGNESCEAKGEAKERLMSVRRWC